MVDRRGDARLASEPRRGGPIEPVGLEDLDGYETIQMEVTRLVDCATTTTGDLAEDLVTVRDEARVFRAHVLGPRKGCVRHARGWCNRRTGSGDGSPERCFANFPG